MIKYSYMELRINPFSPRGAGKHATCTFIVHVFVNQLALKKNHKKKSGSIGHLFPMANFNVIVSLNFSTFYLKLKISNGGKLCLLIMLGQ